jgi:hypothetical protein
LEVLRGRKGKVKDGKGREGKGGEGERKEIIPLV